MKKSSVLFILSLLVSNIYATIHYTSVGENVYPSTPRYYDLDLDGDNDFQFTATDIGGSTGTQKFYVNCSKPTSFYAAEGTSDTLPKSYAQGAGLGTHHWQNTKGLLASSTIGYFRNSTKYLVVQFSDGTDTYYGWFLIYHSGLDLYIESFAYSDVPDEIIAAGATDPTGIKDIDASSFQLAGFNRHHIAFQNCTEYDKVSVYTLEGRTLNEIHHPVSQHYYSIEQADAIGLVTFFRKGKLLYTTKHFIQSEE